MDIMETISNISNDEGINQVEYVQSGLKTADNNAVNTNTTHDQDPDDCSITLAPATEYETQLKTNENVPDEEQNNIQSEHVIAENIPAGHNNEADYSEGIPTENDNSTENVECSAISLEEQEHVEHLVVTNESEITSCTDETVVNVESETIQNVSEMDVSFTETCSVDSSEVSEKLQDSKDNVKLDASNTVIADSEIGSNEHDGLFIGEVDESVSLPPAEPLILEHEEVTQENVETLIEEHVEEEIVTDNVATHEIEIADTESEEVLQSDVNIQYTVLPPGENSVYQEDGTLVVEYPLHSTELTEEVAQNSQGFIEESSSEAFEVVESSPAEIIKQEKPSPKPKGRKSSGQIPLHILGHNIDKPIQEVLNGKQALKPRLGVKIPYRHLASQIVSTTELQQHIVERARQKQEAQSLIENTNSFAKKLTHRLAKSLSCVGKVGVSRKDGIDMDTKPRIDHESDTAIVGSPVGTVVQKNPLETVSKPKVPKVTQIVEHSVESSIEVNDKKTSEIAEQVSEVVLIALESEPLNNQESSVEQSDTIENIAKAMAAEVEPEKTLVNIGSNSDLIAILEGDGDETSPILAVPKSLEVKDSMDNSSEIREIEKEISMTEQKNIQLTPSQTKGKKFFKSRDSRLSDASKEKVQSDKSTELKVTGKSSGETKVFSHNSVSKSEKSKDSNIKSQNSSFKTHDTKSSSSSKHNDLTKSTPKDKEKDRGEEKKKRSATVVEVEPQLKPAMVLKTYTRKRKSEDVSTPEPPKKPLITPTPPPTPPEPKVDFPTPVPPDVYVTKSSRIIKKKVIWDPDEAMPSARNQSKILSKIEATSKATPSPKTLTIQKAAAVKAPEKRPAEKDKRIDTPKPPTKPVEKKIVRSVNEEKETKTASPDKQIVKKLEKTETSKIKTPTITKIVSAASAKISPGKSPKKTGKRLSEIDKLLMDEGAVNMLYDINNSDDQKRRASSRTATTTIDKVQQQKELMDRTQEIKNELTQGTAEEAASAKSLRKKDAPQPTKKESEFKEMAGPPVSRKMSKDSSKSSVHSPPPSPAAFTLADASRIIRRHSSSSFSSNDDLVQEASVDDVKDKEKQIKKKSVAAPGPSSKTVDEEVSPAKDRGIKKKAAAAPEVTTPRKKPRQEKPAAEDEVVEKPVEITLKCEPGVVTGELKTDPTKTFTLIKMNKHYMINLTYSGSDNYLTIQLLKELTVTLRELGRNKHCNVVSLHSQGPAFCLGLDYKSLVESSEDLRKRRATELSNCIREFLKCLFAFPKVLVAGIKGDCVGFGVTMLPLFDMIVASDSASFCTPYAKLGCAPEAGFLLSIPFQSNHGLAAELLYTTQRMNADEAQRRGLVTKLFWPEKFDTEFRALLSHISNLSKVGLMATKRHLRMMHFQSTETALVNNCKLLTKLWIGEECQKNFTNYNAVTFDIDQ